MNNKKNRNTPDHEGRKMPRISLNKLGEYTAESNPSRRWRIIRDQKYPDSFGPPYYSPIRNGIVEYVAKGEEDFSVLKPVLKRLENRADESDWHYRRYRSSVTACSKYYNEIGDLIDQEMTEAVPVRQSDPSEIWIEGVRVTIRPDLLIYGRNGRGENVAGCIKLHFSKTYPLNETSGKYVATILHQFVKEQLTDDAVKASRQRCMVVDVSTGMVYRAPRAFKKRRQEVATACMEISTLWAQL